MSQSGEQQVSTTGAYDRKPSTFRDSVVAGGRFAPEAGRYHLHVALACPWACGTLSMLYVPSTTPFCAMGKMSTLCT